VWTDHEPDLDVMLENFDCALLIGDPSLQIDERKYRKFDLVELWRSSTGLGFVFAMWMTKRKTSEIDFATARNEGLVHLDDIVSNYESQLSLSHHELKSYLSQNISYSIDESMRRGMEEFFRLAEKNGLIARNKPLVFTCQNSPD
jgi:predicted solute-binding protein